MDNIIIENLSPLVGAKVNNQKWSPTTAYQIGKNLRFASLVCLDIDNDKFTDESIRFQISNRVSLQTAKIHEKAKGLHTDVIDTSYILLSQKDQEHLSFHEALYLYSLSKRDFNCAILSSLNDSKIKGTKYENYLYFIILDAFSLRWSLYDYYINGEPFEYGELGKERLNRLINNIYYTKNKLEEYNAKESLHINHHLTTLLRNVLQVRYELGKEHIEVEKR